MTPTASRTDVHPETRKPTATAATPQADRSSTASSIATLPYVRRSLYCLARLFTGQLTRGDPYEQVNQTIAISLLDYVLFPEVEDLHSTYRFHDVVHGRELSDVLEIHYSDS